MKAKKKEFLELMHTKTEEELAVHFGVVVRTVRRLINKIKKTEKPEPMIHKLAKNKELVVEIVSNSNFRNASIKLGVTYDVLKKFCKKNDIKRPQKPKPVRQKKPKIVKKAVVTVKPKKVIIPKQSKQPRAYNFGGIGTKNQSIKVTKPKIAKPKIYPLPQAGQCKYLDDDFVLCTNKHIEGSPYCQEHHDLCYVQGAELTMPKEARL